MEQIVTVEEPREEIVHHFIIYDDIGYMGEEICLFILLNDELGKTATFGQLVIIISTFVPHEMSRFLAIYVVVFCTRGRKYRMVKVKNRQ